MKEEKILQEVVESPAKLVDKTATMIRGLPGKKPVRVARKYFGSLGPGLTTGAADDDPSGIATYSQAGAQFGFRFIWLSLYTLPFMYVVQEMSARIAHVTGRGLSGVLKHHYPRWILYLTVGLLFAANTLNIGVDIGGMVAATRLLINVRFGVLALLFTVLILALAIYIPYHRYAGILKGLAMALLAYVLTAFFVRADWLAIAKQVLVPSFSFNKESFFLITAILGTTISPYLFYWQASQEIEQQRSDYGRETLQQLEGTNPKEIKAMRKDVATGMIFSNIIMFFIIAVTGAVLFSKGISINTAADAASALAPFAGSYAKILFAIGIIGVGLLAIPVLAGSISYGLTEAINLPEGLNKKLNKAYGFYGVIIIALVIGLLINLLGFDPIKALIFSAAVNGVVAPVIMTMMLLAANNKKIMGEWKNGTLTNTLGWLITIVMYGVGAVTIVQAFL